MTVDTPAGQGPLRAVAGPLVAIGPRPLRIWTAGRFTPPVPPTPLTTVADLQLRPGDYVLLFAQPGFADCVGTVLHNCWREVVCMRRERVYVRNRWGEGRRPWRGLDLAHIGGVIYYRGGPL